MNTTFIRAAVVLLFLFAMAAAGTYVRAQDQPGAASPVLVQAVMCEAIENFKPVNQAVVFSISLGRVYCFTAFDPVLEQTDIYHRWFRQDRLISNAKLVLTPPKWSSFSSVQLRSADKGPWRVEIVDSQGMLMKTLRFSISD
ncbi:MAG: DUF2914 domain-containing protein [Desulfobacteraceae bacterium]|nr:DUF2914 domain-containing protein [Desulfobacteraceae bacterium]